jgi:Cu2+-containing amine oxidase
MLILAVEGKTGEQECDLRRHSHIGTFRRGLSMPIDGRMNRFVDTNDLSMLGIEQNESNTNVTTNESTAKEKSK